MKIEIFSKPNCIYCDKSKTLLKGLGFTYIESSINDFENKEQLVGIIDVMIKKMA